MIDPQITCVVFSGMSIVKPNKLGIISGPGTEKFTASVLKHLRKLYTIRYRKLSSALSKRHNMGEDEILKFVTLIEDLNNKRIPHNKPSSTYLSPNFEIPVRYTKFANGEVKTEVLQSVRGLRVFIIYDVANQYPVSLYGTDQPEVLSINDHLMYLWTTVSAVQVAGAESVHLVLPTYPYSRQHKKSGREGLTASWFGHICEHVGVARIITLDIHSREIENSFSRLRLENLHASYQILLQLKKLVDFNDPDLAVVSPDTGAILRNKFFAESLQKPLAMLYKERDYSQVSRNANSTNIKVVKLLGEVENKTVFMADDMLGTGGTLLSAMREIRKCGAKTIICAVSLPFFNRNSIEIFDEAYREGVFYRIIGTNAVYHDETLLSREWYIHTDVSDLFARIISRIHHGRSLSPLLDNRIFIQNLIKDHREKSGEQN
jgi:ribose-phosphate pyrophosphokinase